MSFQLIEAIKNKNSELVDKLVLDESLTLLNAIKLASNLGYYDILKILLESRGFEPNSNEVLAALKEAAKMNHKDCVEFIIKNFNGVDPTKAMSLASEDCYKLLELYKDPFKYNPTSY